MDVQQLFRNLRKEAECPLCLETVNEPRLCHVYTHSVCCVSTNMQVMQEDSYKQQSNVPYVRLASKFLKENTFGGLPTSFHLNRLVNLLVLRDGSAETQRCSNCDESNIASCYCFVCQNFLCTACFEAHQRIKATRGHRNVLVENLQAQDVEELIRRPVMCSQQYHEDQALEYSCEECQVCVCLKCSVVSHNRHSMVDMQKAADEQKMQISEALEKLKAEVVFYKNQMKKETELMERSKTEISAAQRKMAETVDDCIRILTEHKLVMNTKFNEISQAQFKAHATQIENFQFAVTQLKSSVEQGKRILERNINAEILQTKQVIIGRCEELLIAKKPEIYKPPHVHYIVENKTNILDRVVESKTDPLQSLIEGHCEKEAEEKTERRFTIVTRDSDGIQCYHGDDHIKVSIQTPTGKLKTEMKDSKDGKYTVTYTPDCVGQHRVGIEVNGQPLTGSPWSVQVVSHQYHFLFKFGSSGKETGQLSYSTDIAVSEKTGTIAVADTERIQLFSSDGNYLGEIKLDNCHSLAFTKSGEILTLVKEYYDAADGGQQHYDNDDDDDVIVDKEDDDDDDDDDDENDYTCKISLFSECGQFIKHINNEHTKKAMDVSVGSDDHIVTCDWDNNEIRVISQDGTQLLQSFRAPDCDKSPSWAVYHQDTFFVSYDNAHCIKVFNKEGMFLYNIGSEGSGDGQLSYPAGIAIDKFNNLIVCDAGNERIQVFTLDGKFLTKIEQQFFKNSFLLFVAIDKNGQVLVVKKRKKCVYVFQ